MQLQFQLTEAEHTAAQYLFARRSPGVKRSLFVLGTICMAPLVGAAWLLHLGQLTPQLAGCFFALPIAYLAVLGTWLPLEARNAWFYNPHLHGPMEIRCDADGIDSVSESGAFRVAYRDFDDWFEDEQFVLLMRTTDAFYIVPKRAFATPGDLEVLRGWFQRARGGAVESPAAADAAPVLSDAAEVAEPDTLWKIEFQLTEREALAANWLRFRTLWRGPIGRIANLAIAFLLAQCAYSIYQNPAGWPHAARPLVGLIVIVGLLLLAARRHTRRNLRASGELDGPTVAELSRHSLRLRRRSGWQRIKLSQFQKLGENSALIVLIQPTGHWHTLPKRAFQSPDQIDVLRQLVGRG